MYWLLVTREKRKVLPFWRLMIPVVIMSVLVVLISVGVRVLLSGELRPWVVFFEGW